MTTTAQPHSGARRAAPFALVACLVAGFAAPGFAQETPVIDVAHGALLIHGNFCGPGNRGPRFKPVDALDAACMRHDACSPPRGQVATCACNDRLRQEAEAVAASPHASESLRDTATLVADTAILLPCK